jgi:threonine dehydratase
MGGVTVALKESRPAVRVFGVEPVTSNALQKGLEAGEPVRITPVSVADGLGAPTAGRLALQIAQRYLDDVVLIDDPTILAGLRFSLERLKQVVEPAGAAALAAVLSGAVPLRNGDRVCVILSGGNVAVESLGGLLAAAGSLPSDR